MNLFTREIEHGRCARRQIACALFDKDGDLMALTHNGPLNGVCNCPGKDVPAGAGSQTVCYAMHAEARALASCSHISDEVHLCVTNKAPCRACTLLLLGTPCQKIAFLTPSNETENRDLWLAAGREWVEVNMDYINELFA